MQAAVDDRVGWGWRLPKGGEMDQRPATHTLMGGGGQFSVPRGELGFFWRALATEMLSARGNEFLTFVEKTPECFRFFLDLDTKYFRFDAAGRLGEGLCDLVGVIHGVVSAALPGATVVHVARALPPDYDSGPDVAVTWGAHLVWPGTRVCLETAEVLLRCIQKFVVSEFGGGDDLFKDVEMGGWDKVFDRTVYRSGLRMPFQFKTPSGGNFYVRVGSLHEAGWRWRDPTEYAPADTNAIMEEFGIMTILPLDKGATTKTETAATKEKETLTLDDERFRVLERYFAEWTGTPGARLLRVFEKGVSLVLCGNVRWCPNIGREHIRKTQYLVLNRTALWQRCSCKCARSGAKVKCSEWKIKIEPDPATLKEARKICFPAAAGAPTRKKQRAKTPSERMRVDEASLVQAQEQARAEYNEESLRASMMATMVD